MNRINDKCDTICYLELIDENILSIIISNLSLLSIRNLFIAIIFNLKEEQTIKQPYDNKLYDILNDRKQSISMIFYKHLSNGIYKDRCDIYDISFGESVLREMILYDFITDDICSYCNNAYCERYEPFRLYSYDKDDHNYSIKSIDISICNKCLHHLTGSIVTIDKTLQDHLEKENKDTGASWNFILSVLNPTFRDIGKDVYEKISNKNDGVVSEYVLLIYIRYTIVLDNTISSDIRRNNTVFLNRIVKNKGLKWTYINNERFFFIADIKRHLKCNPLHDQFSTHHFFKINEPIKRSKLKQTSIDSYFR